MKITAIKQQVKRANRYSVFVDDAYSFSLSDGALLDSGLVPGQELTPQQVKELQRESADDKIYQATLNYLAIRLRSTWEVETYLQRKGVDPSLLHAILNKLSIAKLLNDRAFAEAFIRDRNSLRPTSRRKIILELKKRHVSEENIRGALDTEEVSEATSLQVIVARKRKQARYQDDDKLIQYLARQGFNYDDIKQALKPADY